jgi:hypothetical protein
MLSMRRGTSKKSQFVSVFGVQDGGTARGLFNLIQSHVEDPNHPPVLCSPLRPLCLLWHTSELRYGPQDDTPSVLPTPDVPL